MHGVRGTTTAGSSTSEAQLDGRASDYEFWYLAMLCLFLLALPAPPPPPGRCDHDGDGDGGGGEPELDGRGSLDRYVGRYVGR